MKQEELEAQLFELIEQKSFTELTAEEQAFVLRHSSREDFDLQRSLISATEMLRFPDPDPQALVSEHPKMAWYRRGIPLYQAVSAAAAMVLFVWILRSPDGVNHKEKNELTGTSPATATQVIYDTVIREVPVIRTAIKYLHDTVREMQQPPAKEPERPVKASREFTQLALTEELIQSNSSPMKDDKISALLTPPVYSDVTGGR